MRTRPSRSDGVSTILRAIIYARVSKDDSGRGRSPKEQIKSCTADCEFEGWPITAILEDNDRGATRYSKKERENFAKLPGILRAGDVLVVWEPSRITREMGEFSTFCDLLADRGVLLYYDGRLWDMRDDDDRNRVWQDILDGVKSAAKTRKRVLRAMADNREECKPHGRRPPGYDVVRDERTGQSLGRAVNRKQQRILRACADEVIELGRAVSLTQLSKKHAAKWVAAGGGGRFRSSDIKRALVNPTIYGLSHSNGQIIGKGTWDPVLPPEMMGQIRGILCAEDRLTHRGSDPRWLVSYTALCGVCLAKGVEATVQARANPKKKPGAPTAPPEYQHDGHLVRNVERTDQFVEEMLLQLMEDPAIAAWLRSPAKSAAGSIEADLAEIEQLRADMDAYVRDAAKTKMSARAVSVYVEAIEEDIRAIEHRISAAQSAPTHSILSEMATDPRRFWDLDYTIEQKRALVRSCMRVVIMPIGRVGRPKAGQEAPLGVEVWPIGDLASAIAAVRPGA